MVVKTLEREALVLKPSSKLIQTDRGEMDLGRKFPPATFNILL